MLQFVPNIEINFAACKPSTYGFAAEVAERVGLVAIAAMSVRLRWCVGGKSG